MASWRKRGLPPDRWTSFAVTFDGSPSATVARTRASSSSRFRDRSENPASPAEGRSGRARPTTRRGTGHGDPASARIQSTSCGSAHWRSSTRSTVGRRDAIDSRTALAAPGRSGGTSGGAVSSPRSTRSLPATHPARDGGAIRRAHASTSAVRAEGSWAVRPISPSNASTTGPRGRTGPYGRHRPASAVTSRSPERKASPRRVFPIPASPRTITTREVSRVATARSSRPSRDRESLRPTNPAGRTGATWPSGSRLTGARAS